MKKHIGTLVVLLALVAVVVIGRVFAFLPNFTPVMAVGLFSAYFFRNKMLAIATPLIGMLVTDLFFEGTYTLGTMAFVYLGLGLPALLGFWVAKNHRNQSGKSVSMAGKLAISAAIASTFFFLISNLGVWLFDGMYATNLTGFVACYGYALPFYKFSLLGDLAYTLVLFGAYGLFTSLSKNPIAKVTAA